jgi:hypothetical protein
MAFIKYILNLKMLKFNRNTSRYMITKTNYLKKVTNLILFKMINIHIY